MDTLVSPDAHQNVSRTEANTGSCIIVRTMLGIVLFLSAGLLATSQDIDSQGSPTIRLNLPPDIPSNSVHINYFQIIAAVDGKPAERESSSPMRLDARSKPSISRCRARQFHNSYCASRLNRGSCMDKSRLAPSRSSLVKLR